MTERPIRAIVYGVGAMGSIMAKLLLDKGVEIVGAVARSPEKVGRDLGDVAGLGSATGVVVEADARRALEAGADVALVSVASYLSVMADHFRLCLEHGCNVITIEEESLWPWRTAPELAAELDQVGKTYGASLVASGAQDVFWLNIVSCLMGAAHRVETVEGRCSWNADDYGPEVARHVRVGDTREEFERHIAEHGWPDFVVRATLEALAAEVELTPARAIPRVEPVLARTDRRSRALDRVIPTGCVVGVVDGVTLETEEGPVLSFEMAGRIYEEGDADMNEWTVRGDPPELHLRNDRVPTRLITCTSVVNRIPDVINAEPGFVTLDQLPRLRYRHFPLHHYLAR